MKISDELRKWCDEADVDGNACDELRVLADRIDLEMMELPKDADGEPRRRREVTRMATEAQIKAQKKYDAENTRQVHLKLNRRTDEDVLEKLDSVPSKQGYIKALIRADLKK